MPKNHFQWAKVSSKLKCSYVSISEILSQANLWLKACSNQEFPDENFFVSKGLEKTAK